MNTISLAAYILSNWEPAQSWDRSQLVPWVDWFVDDQRIVTVQREGRIVGLGMGRCLKSQDDHDQPYAHTEDGEHAWIDLIISKDKHVGSILWDAMLERFGTKKTLGFQRQLKPNSKVRFHNFNQMQRIMCHG